jgi:outer membrane immunogenic protein
MKKILLSSVALLGLTAVAQAADLPARTAPIAPIAAVPIFTWTGFYVGAQVGYAFSDSDDNNNLFLDPTATVVGIDGVTYQVNNAGLFEDGGDDDGFTVGGHVGYNFQFGAFVVGAEADIEWVDVGGGGDDFRTITALNGPNAGATFAFPSVASEIEFIGSLRARLGWAWDRALIYATGGLAYASFDTGDDNFLGVGINPLFANGDDDTVWGWTIGAGVEWAFTNNLTARLEYRYTSFDRDNNTFFVTPGFSTDDSADFHAVRLGVSYKFGTY